MRKLSVLLLIFGCFGALSLSGCATPMDRDIARDNNKTIQNHDKVQERVVKAKTTAIQKTYSDLADKCQDKTFACGALLGMSASNAARDIASIQTREYAGPMQKTGVDVQNNGIDKVGGQIPIMAVAINGQNSNSRPNQTVNTGGGDATLEHSMTSTAQTTTTSSGSSTVEASPADNTKSNSDNPSTVSTVATEAGTETAE